MHRTAFLLIGLLATLVALSFAHRESPAAAPTQVAQGSGSRGNYSSGSGSRRDAPVRPSKWPAYFVVYLPANAQLEIDGDKTQQTGEVRRFESPPLPFGKKYQYTLKVAWKEGAKDVVRERAVLVEAGKETVVDLRPDSPVKEGPARKGTPVEKQQ